MQLGKEKIYRILELWVKGDPVRGIARKLGISKNTSKRYIRMYENSESKTKFWNFLMKPLKKLPKQYHAI